MTALLIVIVFLLATVIAIDLGLPYLDEWFRRRQAVRESAIEADLKAMLGAQQLALLAWKARHEMYDIVEDNTRSDGDPYPTRFAEKHDR